MRHQKHVQAGGYVVGQGPVGQYVYRPVLTRKLGNQRFPPVDIQPCLTERKPAEQQAKLPDQKPTGQRQPDAHQQHAN